MIEGIIADFFYSIIHKFSISEKSPLWKVF